MALAAYLGSDGRPVTGRSTFTFLGHRSRRALLAKIETFSWTFFIRHYLEITRASLPRGSGVVITEGSWTNGQFLSLTRLHFQPHFSIWAVRKDKTWDGIILSCHLRVNEYVIESLCWWKWNPRIPSLASSMPSPVHYGQLRVIRRTLTLRAKINSSEDVLNLSKLRGFSIWKHVLCLLTLKELSELQVKASGEHADRAAFFSIVQLAVLYAGGS